MVVRRDAGAEGAAALALGQLGVDPALVEEVAGNIDQSRREVAKGCEYDVLGLREGYIALIAGDRRIAVVVGEFIEVEDPALEAVVIGDSGVVCDADLGNEVDDFGAQLVV